VYFCGSVSLDLDEPGVIFTSNATFHCQLELSYIVLGLDLRH
jgi:hypothetical protein